MAFRRLLLVGVTLVSTFLHSRAQENDIQTIYERRLPFIVASSRATPELVQSYMSALRDDGTWAEVNYATGCDAQRANWPAGVGHWNRVIAMAAAYHGGVEGAEQYVKNPELRTSLSKAMEYWFANDFSTIGNGACMDGGGKAGDSCPCGTPGLWNTNWYSNVILVPTAVGKTCLLLRDELTPTELGNCTHITARAYTPFFRNPQPGYVAGANIMDIASMGISGAILENNRTGNASRLADAYERVHNELVIHPEDRVDGVKPDGSFQQHIGIIYNGNYGWVFARVLMELELQAANTVFQADETSRGVLGTLVEGTQWMIFADAATKVLHWDYTVIPRFIAFAIADNQATAGIGTNLTQIQLLGDAWNQPQLQKFASDLSKTPESSNPGDLTGNRMFWNSDYMVHRTQETVTTLKLLSSRTKTSECVNTQNPYGFHLSDGAMYQYTTGAEYYDMYATFDWNLVPGSTTDYGATFLDCSATSVFGVDPYAGGVSAGDVGVAAMRYTNPQTKSFSFRKAWFFFGDNVQHVLVNSISKGSNTAPVYSVLEQRLHNGPFYVNGESASRGNYSRANNLWHSGTGYVFPESQGTELWVEQGEKTGEWKNIGTSTQPAYTKDMFSASILHDPANLAAPVEYSIFPATSSQWAFQEKAQQLTPKTVVNDGTVSAALDSHGRVLGAAFWNEGGGSVRVAKMGLTIYADRPLVLMLKLTGEGNRSGEVHVADPTHGTGVARVRLVRSATGSKHRRHCTRLLGHAGGLQGCVDQHPGGGRAEEIVLDFELPEGGMAGSGVKKGFSWSS